MDVCTEKLTISALLGHLPLSTMSIHVVQPHPKPKASKELIHASHVVWVCCPRAQSAQPQRIQRDIQGDQTVLRNMDHHLLARGIGRQRRQREEQE
ncbi:hypothetical protein D3C77_563290 [compost metagenome]